MNCEVQAVEYVQVARVRPKSGGPWAYMEAHTVQDWMNDSDTPSGHYEVEGLTMTRADFEALPEFEA